MPFTVNGIGTATVPGGGFVRWGSEDDCDAIECFVVIYLPLLPLSPMHTFEWSGNQYRYIPLRWSLKLVAKSFVRRWTTAALIVGGLLTVIGGLMATTSGTGSRDAKDGMEMLLGGGAILAVAFGLWKLLAWFDRRDRQLRMVLGPHSRGSSDPAAWTEALLKDIRTPQDLYGAPSFVTAARNLLGEGRFNKAMWAARLAVAKEDAVKGEALTDEILAHPKVRDAVDRIAAEPGQWQALLAEKAPPQEASAATG